MPAPFNSFHKLLGRLIFRMPGNQYRWRRCLDQYLPILESAFKHNDAARLLVMDALEQIEANDIEAAQQTLEALRPAVAAAEESPPELALWHILHALHQHRSGHLKRMAANLKSAHKYGHRYYKAHTLHGEYLFSEYHVYDEAEEHFTQAIDCLYAYPPLTEKKQLLIAAHHAALANVRTMMHHYDDAKESLRLAGQMHAEEKHLLYGQAMLNAALRLPDETERCLTRLEQLDAEAAEMLKSRTRRILDEQHPHFTALPIGSPEGIEDFWRSFLKNEQELLWLLSEKKFQEAADLIFAPLRAMDSYEDDYWFNGLRFAGNTYELTLASCYSRTYTPWIDALLAACPPEVHQRWRIIRKP